MIFERDLIFDLLMRMISDLSRSSRDAVESQTMRLVPTFCKLLGDPNAEVGQVFKKIQWS